MVSTPQHILVFMVFYCEIRVFVAGFDELRKLYLGSELIGYYEHIIIHGAILYIIHHHTNVFCRDALTFFQLGKSTINIYQTSKHFLFSTNLANMYLYIFIKF